MAKQQGIFFKNFLDIHLSKSKCSREKMHLIPPFTVIQTKIIERDAFL